jgi:hypothetical protein
MASISKKSPDVDLATGSFTQRLARLAIDGGGSR